MLFASYGVRRKKIRGHIVTFHFPEDFVGAVLVYVLNVKDWIDEVFVLKRAKTVFPAYAGEKCAVAKSGLAIQVKFGGPPSRSAVLQFSPERMKVIAAMLGPESRKVFDLKVAGLFQIVIVGNKIGAFLASCGGSGKQPNQGKCKSKKKRAASDQGKNPFANELQQRNKTNLVLYWLQLTCNSAGELPSREVTIRVCCYFDLR
jgi:hypothetical protein